MTPEGKVKERVKRLFKKYGVYYHMPVQNGMGAPSLDFIACVNGGYLGVETKAGNKQPTPRQWATIEAIVKSNGQCFIVNEESGLEELEKWLREKTTS